MNPHRRSARVANRQPTRAHFAALLAATAVAAACSEPARPRGVLLVSVDSLRADHVGAYGYQSATRPGEPTTPAVDRLMAREGALFEHAVSTTSWTLPAHLALLTGLPNEVHGVRDLPDRLPADRALLQETFQRAGWRTFGIWSGPNLHPWFGFERGFDAYVDCSTSAVATPDQLFGLHSPGQWNDVKTVHDGSHLGVTGPAILSAFEGFAESLEQEPFFAFVHMWDVHYDYNAPPEFDVFFPGYQGPIDGQDFKTLALGGNRLSQEDLARLLSLYDAEIRYTDHNFERMLGALAAKDRLKDTLVVFTSDHGEEFLEHGALGHKATLYEEVLRVPLLFRLPGEVKEGRRHGGLVSLLDVAPTIAEWCDLPFVTGYGRSLVPVLQGRAASDVRAVPIELTVRPIPAEFRGVHGGDYKLLKFGPDKPPVLFDLAADPLESRWTPARNLPAGDGRLANAEALWQRMDRDAARLGRADGGELPSGLTRDLEKAGYLGEGEPAERGD